MYNGLKEVTMDDAELAKFYEDKKVSFESELFTNQYLLIKNLQGDYVDKYQWNGEKLVKLNYKIISNSYVNKIKPRNVKQECAFDLLQDNKTKVKLITGEQGGGKTYLAILHALDAIEKGKYKKLIYIRNNIEVSNTEKLGALPNGLKDKLMPFIMPIVDILGSMIALESLEKQEKIEYVHLGHLRGRSFSDSIILVSEFENSSKEHAKLIIGRVGEGSTIIFEGDLSQTDKPLFEKNNGIVALREILAGNILFGAVDFDKSERSEVAELSRLFK